MTCCDAITLGAPRAAINTGSRLLCLVCSEYVSSSKKIKHYLLVD